MGKVAQQTVTLRHKATDSDPWTTESLGHRDALAAFQKKKIAEICYPNNSCQRKHSEMAIADADWS